MKLFTRLCALTTVLIASCNGNGPKPGDDDTIPEATKSISYSIVATYPHDTSSFTEGLLFYKGELFESTGEKGESKLIKTDLKTGKPIKSIAIGDQYFGEGIVIINDTVYMLTYQDEVGLMYDVNNFKKLGEFKFASKEGWGMTTDGKRIIASDGTSNLYYYEPGSFKLLQQQTITEAGNLAFNINELEYIDGFIYANQWQAPYILKIDPAKGEVVGKIDLGAITETVKAKYPFALELNGIAFEPSTKKIYITGKNWPELYEIQLGQ